MKHFLVLLLAAIALLNVSCDRFDHTRPLINFDAEIFEPLEATLNAAGPEDLSNVMGFYDADYLHDAVDKAGREDFYHSLFVLYGNDISFETAFSNYNPNSQSVNWELRVLSADKKAVLQTIVFNEEKIVKDGTRWFFFGNRITDLEQGDRQRVFIESFTYTTCPNCPLVEGVMHSLQTQYPAQFTYMEYHMGDPLDIGNSDIFSYYGYSPMPASIFQGIEKRLGANPEALDAYIAFAQNMVSATPSLHIRDLNYQIVGQTLSGSVRLVPASGTIDQTDLRLRYVLIEKVSSVTNSAGIPCTNVVRAKGSLDISSADLSSPVNFALPFTGTLPTDTSIVIMAQKYPTPFANNAQIYNGIEIPLNIAAK